VRLLLIRPPSRSRIIIAKYITTLFYTAGLVLFLGLLCILLGLTLFGSGDLIIHHYGRFGITYLSEGEIPLRMFFAFMAAIWSMMVVASIAFLLSTLVENSVGPIIGTMAVVVVFLVMGNFPLDFFRSLKPYLFTSYMTFWQRFLDDPIPWQEIGSSAAVLGLHAIVLFLIALGVYTRKDIKS